MGFFSWVKGIGGGTLYHSCCSVNLVGRTEIENYMEVFRRLKIPFEVLEKDTCCGIELYHAGYKKEARRLAASNYTMYKKHSIRKIIVDSPACYYFFREVYPQLVREWDIEVEHATVAILRELQRRKIQKGLFDEAGKGVYYHDPCFLGRHSGIYEEPREVIERFGCAVLEFTKNRELADSSGIDGGYLLNFPEVAKRIAKKRISSVEEGFDIVTPCILSHQNFNKVHERSREFSTFVLGKLRGLGI